MTFDPIWPFASSGALVAELGHHTKCGWEAAIGWRRAGASPGLAQHPVTWEAGLLGVQALEATHSRLSYLPDFKPEDITMVRATNPRHVIMLVVGLTALCVALPQTVMAIDLSRLYGHLNAKRNGESTSNLQLHSTTSTTTTNICTVLYIYIIIIQIY